MKIGWTKAEWVFQDCCCLNELVFFILGYAYFVQNMAGDQRVSIMDSKKMVRSYGLRQI